MSAFTLNSSHAQVKQMNSQLRSEFKDAEARHWTTKEFSVLLTHDKSAQTRIDVARVCYDNETRAVDEAIDAIFEIYPYHDCHEFSTEKCARDVTNVSTYAIHSMLIDDLDWFNEKLLFWLRTILQSFDFPARSKPKETLMFGNSEITEIINSLPAGRQSIFETYYLLEENYKKHLSEEQFEIFRPFISTVKDLLAGE